jgi:hypothetical protein
MKDDRLRLADEIIKSKDNMLKDKDGTIKGKDDTIKSKDEIIKDKDNIIKSMSDEIKSKDDIIKNRDGAIKGKDDIIKSSDDVIKSKDNTIKKLNTDLFVAQGKLTLRSALEQVEKYLETLEEIPRAGKNQSKRECLWTWILRNNRYVKDAFEINSEEDVRRWTAVAVNLYRSGCLPLHTLPSILTFDKQGLSDDEITFANRVFNLLNRTVIRSPDEMKCGGGGA